MLRARRIPAAVAACLSAAAGAWCQAETPERPAETPDEPGAVWAAAAPGNFQPANRPGERSIDMVVIHDIEVTAESAVKWFQNPMAKVSAHYVVGADGK